MNHFIERLKMSNRFFAFGCSYTKYSYATWADFVGINFDEYYNYGCGGASNTYIMNKFIDANDKFDFNSNDTVIIMLTGIGRFSYYNRERRWTTNGDLYEYHHNTKDPVIKSFVDNMYSEDWGIYSAWIAAKAMEAILKAKNVKYKFLMSIDNSNYLDVEGCKWGRVDTITQTDRTKELYDMLSHPRTLDEWMKRNSADTEFYRWVEENYRRDGHPTQKMHYNFVKEVMPEYITDKSTDLLNEVEKNFINLSQQKQGFSFMNYQMNFDKSYVNGLF